jgi:hypothetical protein
MLSCFEYEIEHHIIGTCCRTLLSIIHEDIEAKFYASDDSGDFKVYFRTPILYYLKNLLLSKQWNLSTYAWEFVHVGNLMRWLSPNELGRICKPLQRHLWNPKGQMK